MVLYYLKHSIPNRDVPTYLIDTNVRIDYGKLGHLLVVGRQLNGNFDLLRNIIGEERVDVLRIQPSFPLKQLTDEENFLSLLHYFGLLSIRAVAGGAPRLGIPSQTVKRLMYGYLRDAYRDVEVFRISLFRFEQLLMRMANEGEWRPAFEFLGEAIARQTGIRRLHRRGEDNGAGAGAAPAVSGGRAAGAAVSGGTLHRSDRGVPRLGARVLRRRAAVTTPARPVRR